MANKIVGAEEEKQWCLLKLNTVLWFAVFPAGTIYPSGIGKETKKLRWYADEKNKFFVGRQMTNVTIFFCIWGFI